MSNAIAIGMILTVQLFKRQSSQLKNKIEEISKFGNGVSA